jgi:hypothetical protein
MTAVSVVRFRVKPGLDEAFLDAHRHGRADWPGLRRGFIVKTGERNYTLVAEWADTAAIADARPRMIGTLDTFRHALEDLGNGLGVTDPASGEVVLSLK